MVTKTQSLEDAQEVAPESIPPVEGAVAYFVIAESGGQNMLGTLENGSWRKIKKEEFQQKIQQVLPSGIPNIHNFRG